MRHRLLDWLREHGDVVVDPAEGLPFGEVRAVINLKRLGLLSWLGLLNEAAEISVAAAFHTLAYLVQIGGNMVVFALAIAVSRWARRRGSPHLRALVTPVFAVLMLLMWQSSIAVLAASGRLSTTYPLIVLVAALVFVWPPRLLVAVMTGTLGSFVLVILNTPAPAFEQSVTIRMSLLSAFVATIAGVLIHASRQRDYQKTLALHARNEELRLRNLEMDEVMAFAAHDLRSPLLGLSNLLAFAQPRIANDAALATQTIEETTRSVAGMLTLVSRLLDAHEAEHGRLQLGTDDLRLPLSACIGRNRRGAAAVGVSLVLEQGDAAVMARFDPLALERVLDNLVSNAVRFSPPGSTVTLECGVLGDRPRLAIADQGIGLSAAERDHLFEKFRRTRSTPPNGAPGTGLGLFIAATLAERFGARLAYRPRPPQGSIFEIVWHAGGETTAPHRIEPSAPLSMRRYVRKTTV